MRIPNVTDSHMRRYLLAPVASLALIAAACTADGPLAPAGPAAGTHRSSRDVSMPGSRLTGRVLSGAPSPINCTPRDPAYGSAVIGPKGGTLIVGPHRLIVPAGALTRDVLISGTVPNDRPFEINLQPHGLRFAKAAGLILDASSCTAVPNIVYLIDQFTVSPPILAEYSNWWHSIACPIWHFSGYAVAFYDGSVDDSEAVAR